MYIYADQNQWRRILKPAYCLRSVYQPLLSRKTVDRRCLAMLSVPCIWRRASASWPHPLSERGINHVYLSTYFSQTSSVAWHWLAGVFCLSPSQSWPTIETRSPVQDAACGKEKNSQNSHFQQTFQQLFPLLLSPCVGRISGPWLHDHKKVQIFCWSGVERENEKVQTKVQLLFQFEVRII